MACDPVSAPAGGNIFYLDPVHGRNDNAGSAASPWGALQSVVEDNMIETRAYTDLPYDGTNGLTAKNPGAPVKAGDTLVLLDGFHGEFFLRGAYNEYPITIQAAAGQRPTLSRIFLSAGGNWRFKGLIVSPSEAPTYANHTLITVESHGWHGPSSHVVIEDMDFINNTVVDQNDISPGPPWILVNPHKDGTPSRGCVVRNNLAAAITTTGDTAADHNLLITDRNALFVQAADFNFHLRPEAFEAIDAGSDLLAPATDLDGVLRPRGSGIDLGCYEY